ncbi:uncharacterized protein BDR25DRAFT_230166 [Lindgomyces ingoldianus]|uniref:Uncharacterized protein n=1 Tax=Lindgomyces ingoldianus TaxID=673940 RepID=A0ACB6QQK7_9PLEO|nr:uncharacterized protein BDR25DRAFT_230166 [Lindgomyces ingoldianus]KAF2469196.1 hypothetical protein BDR25DRAFT_230166 [Lindgomyces ingoldianus]
MSTKPSYLQRLFYFYPIGNTPAVCLTQSLPPDQDASLLLLGCGDIRNLLFTVYAGMGLGDRKLDFTCCDIEAEIIARNIIALTSIIDDDKAGSNLRNIWNIYYHVLLDAESLAYLQAQAQKLIDTASSIESWNSGPYGDSIRFCDTTTFANVVKLWKFYAIESADKEKYTEQQGILKSQWKAAQQHKECALGKGLILDSLSTFTPLCEKVIATTLNQRKKYWENGTTLEDKGTLRNTTLLNPMFACLQDGLMFHYGTNPLLGFHLATAHAPLSNKSPLAPLGSDHVDAKPFTATAKAALGQFSAWCHAFRDAHHRTTIRYVNSDALALCYVLQHHRVHRESTSASWYRNNWCYQPLVLDTADYGDDGTAPTAFDIIDTSNLMDHLGSLNLLTAAAPLLFPQPSSVIRTEVLLPREENVKDSVKALLCGDLPSVALALGLKPIEYWTNSTATWNPNENLYQSVSGNKLQSFLPRYVIVWKSVDTSPLKYEAKNLAGLIHGIYLDMFQDENFSRYFQVFQLLDNNQKHAIEKLMQYNLYTRASFVAVLQRVIGSAHVNVGEVLDVILRMITNYQTPGMSGHYIQSLFVHICTMALPIPRKYSWWQPKFYNHELKTGTFRNWKDIPEVVCITIAVPRSALTFFETPSRNYGTPACHIMVQSVNNITQYIFPDIQLGFGTTTPSGIPFTERYSLEVQDDSRGWGGDSPLIVSAMVSSCVLIEHGRPSNGIQVGIKSSTSTVQLIEKFGMLLILYESGLVQKDVFVTKYRPNMRGHISLGYKLSRQQPSCNAIAQDLAISIQPCLNTSNTTITSMTIHGDVTSPTVQQLLQSNASVEFRLIDPFLLVLDIGGGKFRKELELPMPLNSALGKGKVARKSCWVEYTAPIVHVASLTLRPDLIFPMRAGQRPGFILENLHYLRPDVLPILQVPRVPTAIEWLASHTAPLATMSKSEFAEFITVADTTKFPQNGRVGFKHSISALFLHFAELQGRKKAHVFHLSTTASEGISSCILFLVNALRMDLANQTVFLDAAVIPLSLFTLRSIMESLVSIEKRGKFVRVNTNDTEILAWKHVLPAMAERCRGWKHKSTCEYVTAGKIPSSTELGKPFMCNCGRGIFPEGFLKDMKEWKKLSKYATRVAISPCFTSPVSSDENGVTLSNLFPNLGLSTSAEVSGGQERLRPNTVNLDVKEGTCFECGATKSTNGNVLMRCARCRYAQYCSAECQKVNWSKEHKHLCKYRMKLNDTAG